MGVFDKIKNALFEVEYVEVDEKPKKEKKIKPKEKTKDKKHEEREEKPIAKKIVLPEKKEDKVEEIEEEELKDEDFEFRPKDETIKEGNNSFKFMDDEDFKVNDEPHIVEILDDEEPVEEKEPERRPYDYSHNDFSSNDSYRIKEKESKPYGLDNTYKVSMHEYGTYEKKDEKVYFKPSPIISPIYGVLDKNYKKEDVVSKKDIRITSNYSRSNVNVDDIRNKAFGRRGNNKAVEPEKEEETKFDVEEEEEEENLLVDLSDEKEKPEVKQVTVGDAMEYFQDLGLEYNVDYVDVSKDKGTPKKTDEKLEEDIKKEMEDTKKEENQEVKKTEKVEPVKNEEKDDDNLFDLIDSMYKDEN